MLLTNQLTGFGVGSRAVETDWATGDRRSNITLTTSFSVTGTLSLSLDGNQSNNAFYVTTDNADVTGQWFKFQFSTARVVNGVRIYNQAAAVDGTGVFQFQGSNDDVSWDDLGASFDMRQSNDIETFDQMAANQNAYVYYRLLGVSGTIRFYYFLEFEFKEEV